MSIQRFPSLFDSHMHGVVASHCRLVFVFPSVILV